MPTFVQLHIRTCVQYTTEVVVLQPTALNRTAKSSASVKRDTPGMVTPVTVSQKIISILYLYKFTLHNTKSFVDRC